MTLAFSLSELLHSGALGYMIDGGIFMWPILALGILAAGVTIERWRTLKIVESAPEEIREKVIGHLTRHEYDEALKFCEETPGPVSAVLGDGLRHYMVLRELNYEPLRIEEQVNKSMESYGVHVVAALEKHLPILATVSSVAPMLGFLGTVQGMVLSFRQIVETMGEINIVEAAAAGIEVALLTTCLGLIVGIPAYMAFNYFMSTINDFVLEVESSAADLMKALSIQMTMQGRE